MDLCRSTLLGPCQRASHVWSSSSGSDAAADNKGAWLLLQGSARLIPSIQACLPQLFTTPTTSKNPVTSPASPPEKGETSSTLTLPDGRRLGYAQYGSRTGRPVILLHGLAWSRVDAAFF